jgi:magnesium transporter
MVGRILLPEIQSMIDARNFTALRELFSEMPPADVAEIILDLPEDEQVIIFRILPHVLAADVFEYFDVDVEAQQKLLRGMAHEQVVSILNEMSPDDRTALLEAPERGGTTTHSPAHTGRAPHRAVSARLSGGASGV